MKFNFKIQQYQTDAVDSIVKVFVGQPYQEPGSYRRDIGNATEVKENSQMSSSMAVASTRHFCLGLSNRDVSFLQLLL